MGIPRLKWLTALLIFLLSTTCFVMTAVAGDAEVSRHRNMQCPESEPNNADIIRYRNMNPDELMPNNADIIRYRNLQSLELAPNDADIIKYRNLQFFELQPNNADIIRYRNLAYFELEPNNADVIRYRNLACMPMDTTLGYEINITSLMITDQNDNPRSNFLRGDVVQFKVAIKNIGNYPLVEGVISVMIFDPTNTPVLLYYTLEDMAIQQTIQVIFGYRIPSTAQLGTYAVKVSVFTDWPSQGGIFLDTESSTFTIS